MQGEPNIVKSKSRKEFAWTIPDRLELAAAIFLASAIGGSFVYSYLANRLPPIPHRTMRIGVEPNPPFQIRTETGYSGIAVDVVNEAARRAGIRLEWVETGLSSDESFKRGLVDLWPLMADLPYRRTQVHLSLPWVISSHILLTRAALPVPTRSFSGKIAVLKMPLHVHLANAEFPSAQLTPFANVREVVIAVCSGASAGGFLEKRIAMTAFRDLPPECAATPLRTHALPEVTVKNCVASTFEAAGAADGIRAEIGKMFHDGALGITMAKYSFYGLDDAWSTYELMESSERGRWTVWIGGALAIAILLALWQTFSLRQRKRAERVLRESEGRFRSIFQQAGVGVAQISLDGKVELANDRYCEVLGSSQRDLLGKGTWELSHKDDLKEQLEMMPRLMSGEIQSFSTVKRYIREDGSVVWAELCKSLVRDLDGIPKCFITVVSDISERKQAEAALKESEERFRNMADSAPVLIWVSGPDKLCTFFNSRWLEFTGRPMELELHEGWAANVHPEDRDRCIATYNLAFDSRQGFQMEYRMRRADGEYRWLVDIGVARFSPDGKFGGYIGSCIDITDLKRNYAQHLATQKLESMGVLAAGVAHDFNNLLGAIVVRVESAQCELDLDSAATEDLEQIRITALRAADIVSQLMTFAGEETAPLVPIDLSSLVAEILELLKVSISKSAVLKTELAPRLPRMHANAAEIQQVAMNLIINASEALEGKPGCIAVTTGLASPDELFGEAIFLTVEDTGCGMTEEVKARIFDPFFTTRFVGRGLGLSAVRGIVRRHGGSIDIESAPGKGSRFTVRLPCATGPLSSPPGVAETPSSSSDDGSAVLFVEDEDSLRSAVAKVLRRRTLQVVEAADGEAAIEMLKADPASVGVVLLDVTLPGISGAELFDELRQIGPRVKVILSTAYCQETVMQEFGGREIWGFIRKPYRVDDLLQLLQAALGGKEPVNVAR